MVGDCLPTSCAPQKTSVRNAKSVQITDVQWLHSILLRGPWPRLSTVHRSSKTTLATPQVLLQISKSRLACRNQVGIKAALWSNSVVSASKCRVYEVGWGREPIGFGATSLVSSQDFASSTWTLLHSMTICGSATQYGCIAYIYPTDQFIQRRSLRCWRRQSTFCHTHPVLQGTHSSTRMMMRTVWEERT